MAKNPGTAAQQAAQLGFSWDSAKRRAFVGPAPRGMSVSQARANGYTVDNGNLYVSRRQLEKLALGKNFEQRGAENRAAGKPLGPGRGNAARRNAPPKGVTPPQFVKRKGHKPNWPGWKSRTFKDAPTFRRAYLYARRSIPREHVIYVLVHGIVDNPSNYQPDENGYVWFTIGPRNSSDFLLTTPGGEDNWYDLVLQPILYSTHGTADRIVLKYKPQAVQRAPYNIDRTLRG